MPFLLASIAALGVGPLIYRLAAFSPARRARQVLDLLVVLAIVLIVLFHILPHSWELAGWLAIVFLVLGLVGPTLIEMWLHRLAHRAHTALGVVVVLGIAFHEFMDGLALAMPDEHGGGVGGLQLAVTIHRVPVGLILWWLVRPRFGLWPAIGILALCAVGTSVAYFSAGHFVDGLETRQLALFEAFLAGSLLHVAVHQREAHNHASA